MQTLLMNGYCIEDYCLYFRPDANDYTQPGYPPKDLVLMQRTNKLLLVPGTLAA